MIYHGPDRELAKSAVKMLEVILADMLTVIGDMGAEPGARLLAQRTAQNIARWDGGTATVKISAPDRDLITKPMRMA